MNNYILRKFIEIFFVSVPITFSKQSFTRLHFRNSGDTFLGDAISYPEIMGIYRIVV